MCHGPMADGIYWKRSSGEGKCMTVKKIVSEGKLTRYLLLLAAVLLGIQAAAQSCGAAPETERSQMAFGEALALGMAEELESALYCQYVPGIALAAGQAGISGRLFRNQVDCLFPVYTYLSEERRGTGEAGETEMTDIRTIMLAEAEEGTPAEQEGPAGTEDPGMPSAGESLEELLRTENEAALEQMRIQQQQEQQPPISSFLPHTKQVQVDTEALRDYETLVRQFYTVDGNTAAGSDELNVGKFLEADMTISKEGEGPQILIYHTHSQEGYSDSVPGEESSSIMGVGDRLTELLTGIYGYRVLHHRGKYDVESRDDAYSNSLADIERVLEENPSIEVVIDLHRDAVPEETRLVTELDGRPTARFMFFNGLSRTKNTGNISYLYNENLDANLAFSFQMQLKAMEYYPGLTRRIYLKGYRYNMHLRPKYLLIELGAQNNTLEEAMNACDPLAHILDLVLSGES